VFRSVWMGLDPAGRMLIMILKIETEAGNAGRRLE
jgi:hypothetical protein